MDSFIIYHGKRRVSALTSSIGYCRSGFRKTTSCAMCTISVRKRGDPLKVPTSYLTKDTSQRTPIVIVGSPLASVVRKAPLRVQFSIIRGQLPRFMSKVFRCQEAKRGI